MKCRYCSSEWKTSISMQKCPFCGKPLVNEINTDSAEGIIASIFRNYGETELRNGRHLLAFFSDLAPERKKERLILSHFVSCGGHTILLDAKKQNNDPKPHIERIVYKMTEELLLSESLSRNICEKYWIGIGGSPMPAKDTQAESAVQPVKPSEAFPEPMEVETPEEQFQKGEEIDNKVKSGMAPSGDYVKALDWYRKAADRGHALAQCKLGRIYKEGNGVPQDLAAAFDLFRKSACQGESCAQLELGYWYWRGDVCKSNPQEAFNWFRKAAEQGNQEAQERLGYCYEKGEGVDQDTKQAVFWYTKAAKSGFASSMRMLGDCYKTGCGVSQSYRQAAVWYEKAASQGDPAAMLDLGELYAAGNGVPKDTQKAITLYESAFSKGEILALSHIFIEYGARESMTEEECQKIVSIVNRIPLNNPTESSLFDVFIAGLCTESCMNVALELVKYSGTRVIGIDWIGRCAQNGLARAQLWLGESYRRGVHFPKNREEAAYWFEKAAAQGDPDAQDRLRAMRNRFFAF